ncbi:putative peptide modification system cyclase [Pseudoxanthomonas suwonensis]|uniref:putative peptide modification system cyclase n=1 Tax=Pseudoxanthomonas suwonensis TaxID=314722 RepID=UPI00130D9C52|nr:putative peptide modification system cyclase [Pseudoxanthomonas suwonensis]
MPHDANAPQLRTLLLTDLCDSTNLVESLGDSRAAVVFRDHDRLVLELQQRWRGRLIDRSDGLLLLFERPLDGLGFALDYRRGLDALGQAHRIGPLLARAGLHVGEVLIWRNSEEAVSAGAKPVEVEGLAKPFAARLMQLARPGQILLSSVAEPLVRRSARELGERGEALQWRTHGRWHFKGVPEVQEVHEVGEPGFAPLRMPRGDAKARREMPLWRRPAALVAEVVLVAGLVVGGWFITRPEPAIAFSERDWVVVGDLRNLTGQTVLDDSLEQAFRISLEQSRYVNVLSDLKVRQTLAQMRLDPDGSNLDRNLASQVALRDGARAVILPSVAEVNNNLQFSVEIIDPKTQATIYSEKASGKGIDSLLDSIDQVAGNLRGKLGEAIASIEQQAAPLPQATTSELDALRAYALAETSIIQGRFDEAKGLYVSALQIDPSFARAHLGLAMLAWALDDFDAARRHVMDAARVRDTLPPRDRLQVDAWQVETSPAGGSLAQWLTLAKLYPDHFGAQSNASWHLMVENRFSEALPHALAASVTQAPRRAYSLVHVARIYTAQGRPNDALEILDQASMAGGAPARSARAEALALLGRREEAVRLLGEVKPEDSAFLWMFAQQGLASLALEEGNPERAIRIAEQIRDRSSLMPDRFHRHFRLVSLVILSAAGKPADPEELEKLAREFRAVLADENMVARHEEMFRFSMLIYLAQRDGRTEFAARNLRWLEPESTKLRNRLVDKLLTVVRANQMRLEGRSNDGANLLRPQLDGSEFVQARVVMRELKRASGSSRDVLEQEDWLRAHRGQALAEVAITQLMQPLNVADVAAAGESAAATKSH